MRKIILLFLFFLIVMKSDSCFGQQPAKDYGNTDIRGSCTSQLKAICMRVKVFCRDAFGRRKGYIFYKDGLL